MREIDEYEQIENFEDDEWEELEDEEIIGWLMQKRCHVSAIWTSLITVN